MRAGFDLVQAGRLPVREETEVLAIEHQQTKARISIQIDLLGIKLRRLVAAQKSGHQITA